MVSFTLKTVDLFKFTNEILIRELLFWAVKQSPFNQGAELRKRFHHGKRNHN